MCSAMARQGRSLDRLLRIRTLQLALVRAEESSARDRFDSEAMLKQRIAELAASVAPSSTEDRGLSLISAAHYRDRLHQSAVAADARLRVAGRQLDLASDAAREAKRDQSAIEKLIERDDAREALKAVRALETLPAMLPKKRHDLC